MSEYITQEKLCELLKLSVTTLYRYRKEGMPYAKFGGIKYKLEEVEEWIKENKK